MNIFKDKVAFITGAASGIGLGMSRRIAELGGRVVLADIDSERLDAAAQDPIFRHCELQVLDVTRFEDFQVALTEARRKLGRIDYLFNNAGVGGTLPIENATVNHWKRIIDLNVFGVINGVMSVLPIMKEQRHGYIVNTSSISGLIPFAGQALYNTTKFAITGLSLSLEKELRQFNIDISIICPGMVRTRIFYKPILGDEASEKNVKIPKEAISVEKAVESIIDGIRKKKRIIITPKFLKGYYWKYRLLGRI